MNSLMTKIYGQRILDGDLLFDHEKITFHSNAKASLINSIAMLLVVISSALNLLNSDFEFTNLQNIGSLVIGILAFILLLVSVIKYRKTKGKISFATKDIKEVNIQEKPKSLRISFNLNNNTTHKIGCAKDRYSGKLVQTLKDADVHLTYL